jgi:glutaredoxin 3
MKPIRIYTTPSCSYCQQAKRLLARKKLPYEEIDVAGDDGKREWLVQATGKRTVPQIFIGEQAIGGSDDLHALEGRGELDALVNG